MTNLYEKETCLHDDMVDFVSKLKKQYKIGTLSNTIIKHVNINKARGVFDNFDTVLNSCEIGLRKPNSEFYYLAAKKLDVAPEHILFIGDKEKFAEAARNIGMQGLAFKSIDQLKQIFE